MLRLVLGKNIQDFEEIRKNIKSDASDVLKVTLAIFQDESNFGCEESKNLFSKD